MKKISYFSTSVGLSLACIFLLLCFGVATAGESGKIAGKVTDAANTREVLVGANIVIEGTSMGAVTDLQGDYYILNVPPGTYTLVASMVGYQTVRKTNVIVMADRTITSNFALHQTVIQGEEVTIVGDREVIPLDVSASQFISDNQQIASVPFVADIQSYMNLQPGIENGVIRGGGLDQQGFALDGMTVNNNRTNKPLIAINLSAVKEMNIITGGFNAEYGNVRSGVISVVGKEGSPSRYHGSIDSRINPSHQKHSGPSMMSANNYWLRPYLDPEVCFVGTDKGTWDAQKQKENRSFVGWNKISEDLLGDGDPSNDLTPQQARNLFIWEHAIKGADSLGQKVNNYANKPDWQLDASFGGPLPMVGRYLGDLSFFASYRHNYESFPYPVISRDGYQEDNSMLKVTSRLSPSMKLNLEAIYNEIQTVARAGEEMQDDWYFANAQDMLYSPQGELSYVDTRNHPFNIYQGILGLSFDHMLSQKTFYNVRLSNVRVQNQCNGPDRQRNLDIKKYFGPVGVDERPWGFKGGENTGTIGDGIFYSDISPGILDHSVVTTLNAKFDLTSQVDKYNQVKSGLEFTYDDLSTDIGWDFGGSVGNQQIARHFPFRFGAYVQDKLEFQGLIANLGLRADYSDPNTEWYNLPPYSNYFKKDFRSTFTELAPKAQVKEKKFRIAPRLGVSHPISKAAKIYFNYGHFYSMPMSRDMYRVLIGQDFGGVNFMGNPYANPPKTVSYELGLEYNIADLVLLHIAGYYKDVSDQTGQINYVNYDESVNYATITNNNYEDIRGFEITLNKRFGSWITGWLNYNYMVQTSGYVGRQTYYQDPRRQLLEGYMNPYQEKPFARPYARANINILSPMDFGPTLLGGKPLADIQLNLLFTWKSGQYVTWDPLENYQLRDNVQWKGQYNVDARFSKKVRVGRTNFTVFADVNNLFNFRNLYDGAFNDEQDVKDYYNSLHLSMYDKPEYQALGLKAGDDKPGDVKSKDKPYIDMPDLDHLWYLNVRSVTFGLVFDF